MTSGFKHHLARERIEATTVNFDVSNRIVVTYFQRPMRRKCLKPMQRLDSEKKVIPSNKEVTVPGLESQLRLFSMKATPRSREEKISDISSFAERSAEPLLFMTESLP